VRHRLVKMVIRAYDKEQEREERLDQQRIDARNESRRTESAAPDPKD